MAESTIIPSKQFATIDFSAQITSGYVVIHSSISRAGAKAFFAPTYQGSGNVEAMTYIYTLQPQEGLIVVYVRKGDGTIPADGKTVGGIIYVEN